MSGARHWEQDKEATVYIGNIDERVTDSLIWELMLQAGRIVNVHLPKDRVTQSHQGYGFVEFISEEDAEYAARIMNQASADKQKSVEVGAELFIGNLDPMVDEKTLYDTFSRFGSLISAPKIARDESALSKGYGFVSYSNFDASDDAIANMNGQYLMNKDISVQYAYKKDGRGERHGDEAERKLASQAKMHNVMPEMQQMPTQLLVNGSLPQGPAAMLDTNGHSTPQHSMPVTPVGFNMPPGFQRPPPAANYASVPPPQQNRVNNSPLPPPPPTGLPQRPPPSHAGYGGPQDFHPPAYAPPSGYPPQQNMHIPQGFGGVPPPSQQMPPGFMPPGFGPPSQGPPGWR
ncbi:hypothetical protein B7494_g1872 [Chlorociboria aeruginascens]|nr:hypothetical protein B7494_g1872 [Chlorociboria aeruginascens]